MLSRVAQRVYWMARYLERAENTARLINVYTHLLLDIPRHVPLTWGQLPLITDSQPLFKELYKESDERSVMRFMLADRRNPGSILASLAQARENSRTSREILPNEAWEQINDLYMYAKEHAPQGVGRRGRFTFLRHVVGASQQLTGLWADTMSHGPAYNFVRIGRTLERADMTSRIMDAGFSNPLATLSERLGQDEPLSPYQNALWMSVLHALSAYQAYRQAVPDRFNVHDAVAFLLKEKAFPRSVAYCLAELSACLKQLPRNKVPVAGATRLQRRIATANVTRLLDGRLHKFIDSLQLALTNIHTDISATWFDLEVKK